MTEASPSALAAVDQAPKSGVSPEFWFQLIGETAAAKFLDLTPRTLQAMRQRGGGPRFVRISARCVKYRRLDLKNYTVSRLRSSTSDPGEVVA